MNSLRPQALSSPTSTHRDCGRCFEETFLGIQLRCIARRRWPAGILPEDFDRRNLPCAICFRIAAAIASAWKTVHMHDVVIVQAALLARSDVHDRRAEQRALLDAGDEFPTRHAAALSSAMNLSTGDW